MLLNPARLRQDSPILTQLLKQSQSMRTSRLWRKWRDAGAPRQVVTWIKNGYRIPFKSKPKPWNLPNPPPKDAAEATGRPVMWRKLVSKTILSHWSDEASAPTFVSPMRGEPKMEQGKATGEFRPICNLRQLNSYVADRKVRYETLSLLPTITNRLSWTTSMDLRSFFDSFRLHPKDARFTVVRAPLVPDPLAVGVDAEGHPILACGARTYRPGHYYAYTCLPQGFKLSPFVVVKCVRWIIEQVRSRTDNVNLLWFIDDILLIAPRKTIRAFDRSIRLLLVKLGLIIHPTKGWTTPTQRFVFLGLGADCRVREFFIPDYKMETLQQRCQRTLQHGRSHKQLVPVKALARLTGTAISLVLASPIMPFFLRSLHDCIASRKSWRGTIRLSTQAQHDIQSLATLAAVHRSTPFAPPRTTTTLTTDASTRGGGGWTRTPEGLLQEVSFLWDQRFTSSEICYLEMRAVLRCLQACNNTLKDTHLTLMTDNMSVMVCINKKSSRSRQLMMDYRDVYAQLQKMNSTLHADYIDTKSNWHADQLSRASDPQDYGWTFALLQLVELTWSLVLTLDCFGSRRFHQQHLPYHSRYHDDLALAVNTFSSTWRHHVCWLTPPLPLIADCLVKVKSDQCLAVLVAPDWPAQPWYPLLLQLSSASLQFDVHAYLQTSDCNQAAPECLRNPSWRWKLFLLDGSRV